MLLKNKKTGKVINSKELLTDEFLINLFSKDYNYFKSKLDKIQEEWEDYEEPKESYWIDYNGEVKSFADLYELQDKMKEIDNYFETREEAEKAVEKLKAVKRLKDKGFRFDGWTIDDGLKISIYTNFEGDNIYSNSEKEIRDDLDLLFGGENE